MSIRNTMLAHDCRLRACLYHRPSAWMAELHRDPLDVIDHLGQASKAYDDWVRLRPIELYEQSISQLNSKMRS